MSKVIIVILCMASCLSTKSQINKFEAKCFQGKSFASVNKDSSFYKLDTIKMVVINQNNSIKDETFPDVANYFNRNDFVTLEFKNHNKLVFLTTLIDGWSIVKVKGSYSWEFNKENQILSLFFNKKLIASFTPLYERDINMKSSYSSKPLIKTQEIVLVKRIL